MIKVRLYRTADGGEPVEKWLAGLRDQTTVARIRRRISQIQLGNLGDCKAISGGVHELRLHFGAGYRLYFAYDGSAIVLLLCGGDKATQSKDIRRAGIYWQNYQEKNNEKTS